MSENKSPRELLDAMPDVLPEETQQATDEPAAEATETADQDSGEQAEQDAAEAAEHNADESGVQEASEDAEEFLETEVFGQKGKVSKKFADSVRGILEKEYSEAQEQKEQAKARYEEAKKLYDEAIKWKESVQAHLDANPEFASNWKSVQAKKQERDKALEVAERMEQYLANQEQEKKRASFEAQIMQLSQKYSLPKNEVYTERDVRIRAADNLEKGMSLEAAYREAASELRGRLKKAGLAYIGSKAKAASTLPQGAARRPPAATKKVEKLTPRQLLQKHLRMNDKDLERF